MDSFLEYLVPIVVFVIWAIGQLLEKRKSGDDSSTPSIDPQEQEEQTRRIQEEIRRKIAERRRQQQGHDAPAPPPLTREETQGPARPSPYSSPPLSDRGHAMPRRKVEVPPPVREEAPVFHESAPRRDLFAELAEQEERMRETQRRAEQARSQARETISKTMESRPRYGRVPRAATSLRSDLLETLRDPIAARKAVLLHEVLGTPVGMRRQGHMRPSWEA